MLASLLGLLLTVTPALAAEPAGPEDVLRTLVRANAEKDLATMAKFMAKAPDSVGYSIAGRKYLGWPPFAKEMEEEFRSVERLEIPITDLKVWTHGDVAWFAMELDYIRYVGSGPKQTRTLLPLRETGVLERRDGAWILVSWHESMRTADGPSAQAVSAPASDSGTNGAAAASAGYDLSGQWEIQEEDKSYVATLDRDGNGTYSWQGGRIQTTKVAEGRIQGSWHQTGNDREGGFEVLLSADGREARGVWWYTRVGDRTNIPPRQWGGTYVWKRLPPTTPTRAAP